MTRCVRICPSCATDTWRTTSIRTCSPGTRQHRGVLIFHHRVSEGMQLFQGRFQSFPQESRTMARRCTRRRCARPVNDLRGCSSRRSSGRIRRHPPFPHSRISTLDIPCVRDHRQALTNHLDQGHRGPLNHRAQAPSGRRVQAPSTCRVGTRGPSRALTARGRTRHFS